MMGTIKNTKRFLTEAQALALQDWDEPWIRVRSIKQLCNLNEYADLPHGMTLLIRIPKDQRDPNGCPYTFIVFYTSSPAFELPLEYEVQVLHIKR